MVHDMLVIEGGRNEIFRKLREGKNEEEVLIKVKPSMALFMQILNMTSAKRICCTPGIFRTIKPYVLSYMRDRGISIEKVEVLRKSKYAGIMKEICRTDVDAKFISKKYSVPLRTVYYHRRRKACQSRT
ncbi:MAG: hypothetical protein QXP42_00035 [Candidatus Micrarchaeia archaeon]